MANESIRPVAIEPFESIRAFFEALAARPHIHLVKVADQGLVEPARRGTMLVMQPMVRVVATAFDYKTNKILRWYDKWDVGSGVMAPHVTNGGGRHDDPTGIRTRDLIILESQKRGLQVERGEEWTPADIVVDTLAGIDRKRG
jgi:hypothetical protein